MNRTTDAVLIVLNPSLHPDDVEAHIDAFHTFRGVQGVARIAGDNVDKAVREIRQSVAESQDPEWRARLAEKIREAGGA